MSSSIQIDPQHPGTIVRRAFLIEAILNLATIPLITHPRAVLSRLLLHPSHINASSIFFARSLGGLVVGALTYALFHGVPNTRSAIESRKGTYVMLGLGEVFLIPVLVAEAMKGGGAGAALSVRAAVVSIASMAPPLAWRCYVLFWRPEMFGRYKEGKAK